MHGAHSTDMREQPGHARHTGGSSSENGRVQVSQEAIVRETGIWKKFFLQK